LRAGFVVFTEICDVAEMFCGVAETFFGGAKVFCEPAKH
jgi:hypothetical protein